jgi:hypothetical protein
MFCLQMFVGTLSPLLVSKIVAILYVESDRRAIDRGRQNFQLSSKYVLKRLPCIGLNLKIRLPTSPPLSTSSNKVGLA